tara:strand:+ start:870 stop:1199 length:330 start_codon:yes stop_codon:yes gene_type:complete
MEFKWSINKVQVAQDNLIVKVDLTITDGEFSASYTKNLVRGDTFTPYEQLTEQQVLDWCFAPEIITFTDEDGNVTTTIKLLKDEGEAQIADQLARQVAQKASEPALPWA